MHSLGISVGLLVIIAVIGIQAQGYSYYPNSGYPGFFDYGTDYLDWNEYASAQGSGPVASSSAVAYGYPLYYSAYAQAGPKSSYSSYKVSSSTSSPATSTTYATTTAAPASTTPASTTVASTTAASTTAASTTAASTTAASTTAASTTAASTTAASTTIA